MADAVSLNAPRHVAIIMDGNGRWAAARGMPRAVGHREGTKAVRRTIEAAIEQNVEYLTLFAFSSENWARPQEEVTDLTGLLRHYLRNELNELHENGVRLLVIGERERFGPNLAHELAEAEAKTAGNTKLTLVMALSYGGRADIVEAARRAMAAGMKPEDLTEQTFAGLLATDGIPDPDLLIRTSGEERISNFLLWQTAYSELYFTDVLWPDFGAGDFAAALNEYARRERRFGARPE
ncbi:MAG: di-trans,poly-cis-decaprenylcistransferase [Acidocella sp. 20-57-95]|nr:MAG: di-trans,poly-cis-decaprenylcistransferase [Acidocella sp. 20-57-95]OYV60726.1 MAG: di-trans,poly-cis-decaprenylcistransferase [Acidocella sp. 21-58-7]HQT64427.1 polyprenyl diphosphate synthase [Acidocella sp.]HQU03631.1 polyprenyl diphosphate synthase [Acidocella sp.]